ncbi:nucleotidyltransferase domain-containing protein [Mesorhizobium sp. M1050]|uniref:nucleotidyltransferase family protein n=1 Tax=Mesorhizobium sp. M1050 TaxID=2957051 RepID=UPI00333BBC9A
MLSTSSICSEHDPRATTIDNRLASVLDSLQKDRAGPPCGGAGRPSCTSPLHGTRPRHGEPLHPPNIRTQSLATSSGVIPTTEGLKPSPSPWERSPSQISWSALSSLSEDETKVSAVRPNVLAAWIYGSVARGEDRPDSDLDIAVRQRLRREYWNTEAPPEASPARPL